MKKLRQSILIALLATGSAAHAVGNVQGAVVVNVDARADGNFLITFSQSSTTPPSCAAVFNRMSGTTSTVGGRAVLANAMLAYATGAQVALAQGTGACSTYGNIESINIFSLGQ